MSEIVLGIRLTADGKDLVGTVKVSREEIDKMGGATRRASSDAEKLNAQHKNLSSTLSSGASLIGLYSAAWNKAADAVLRVASAVAEQIRQAPLLAARYETLGIVMRVAGNNAGYTGAQMAGYTKQLQASGISMLQSRSAVINLATANIDLANASKLGRAAQDLAVVGQINSSEALGRLIYGLKSGQVEVLRTLGLNVTFEAGYKKLAVQLGTTVEKLTEEQKMLARTNVTLEEAARYQGIYEESMTTAGKAMTSLTRYWENFKIKAGDTFLPLLARGVFGLTDALKRANAEIDQVHGSGAIRRWGQDIAEAASTGARQVSETITYLYQHREAVTAIAGAYASWRVATWFGPLIAKTYEAAAAGAVHVAAVVSGNSAAAIALKLDAERAGVLAATAAQTLASAASETARTAALLAEANAQRAMAAEIALFGPQRAAIERGVTAAVLAHTAAVQAQAVAETRATAATEAHAAAMAAASISGRAAASASTFLGRAVAAMGGPIGILITILGTAATAWAVFGRTGKTAVDDINAEIDRGLEIAARYKKEAQFGAGETGQLVAALDAVNKRITLLGQTKGEGAARLLKEARQQADALTAALIRTGSSTESERIKAAAASRAAAEAARKRQEAEELGRAAAKKAAEAYQGLMDGLRKKLLLDKESTESERLAVTLSEKKYANLGAAQKGALVQLAREVDLRNQATAGLEAYVKAEEESIALQREVDDLLASIDQKRTDAILATEKTIEQTEFEAQTLGLANAARERAIALRALETSGIDKQSQAYADLQRRLTTALEHKAIAERNKQLAEDLERGQVDAWRSIERTAHDSSVSIFDSFKSGIDRARDALKNGLYDLLYQMTLKRWIINLSASVSGAGVASSAFGASSDSLVGNLAGSAISKFGGASLFGSGVGGLGGLLSTGSVMTAAPVYEAGALVSAGTSASIFSGSGASAAMAAIPGWGWAALGAAAIGAYLLSDEGDAQRQGNWSARLGQVGGSDRNRWFSGDEMGASLAAFGQTLAASEQQIISTLKLSAQQVSAINAALDAQSGKQYGFGMEHTDWQQSGAAQAIAADRLRAIADTLGQTVDELAQDLSAAQKALELAPAKRQLEIRLLEASGDAVGALAARRKDELAATDALLRPLLEQIYAAEDLAAAANDATGAVRSLGQQIDDLRAATSSAVDDQISASRSAAQAARSAADAYRGLNATLADTVRQLRGGDLSPLLPGQKLAEARAQLNAVYGKAATGDAGALAALPQVATDFLAASRAYNASSAAYTADFNRVMGLLAQAGTASNAAALKQDYQATLLELQTGVLEEIRDLLSAPSPDATAIAEQTNLLSTIGVLLKDQTGAILTGNSVQDVIRGITALDSHYSEEMLRALVSGATTQTDSLQVIANANDMTVSLLRQLVSLTGQKTAQDQAAAAAAAAAEQNAAAERAQAQKVSEATAAFQAQKVVADAMKANWLSALGGVAQSMSVYQAENIAANQRQIMTVAYEPSRLNDLIATQSVRQNYLDAFAREYELYKAIPGHAAGGVASGWSMVGEEGPELVNFATPARVYTADETRAAFGGGAVNNDLLVELKALRLEVAALRGERSREGKAQADQISTAVEESAQTIGRTVARAAEANTRN